LKFSRSRIAVKTITGFLITMVVGLGVLNVALVTSGDRFTALVEAKVRSTLPTNYFGRSYPALYLQKAYQFLDDLKFSSPHTAIPILIAVFGLCVIALRVEGRVSGRTFARVVVGLTAFDLVFMTLTHVPPVDLERLGEVTGGKPDKTQRLLGKFLEQATEISEGLSIAIRTGSARDVRLLAHKFVGASSSLGMVAIVPSLSQLEQMGDSGTLDGVAEVYAEFTTQLERVRQFIAEFQKSRVSSGAVAVS
jgi:HPt (histidine-containing phosphotransfer) domain-containing protein